MSETARQIEQIEVRSSRVHTPCGDGEMIFRIWQSKVNRQAADDVVVMLHGGSGAWSHWIRNIPALETHFTLLIPDLPGLGESATMPKNADPMDVATAVSRGLSQILGSKPFHLIGFSWGCVVASAVAAHLQSQVKSLLLVGPASTGVMPQKRDMKPLLPRSRSMTAAEIVEINKENLARLMIHDRQKIDELAIELHDRNTRLARYNSQKFADSDYLTQTLASTTMALAVIFGERDAVTVPNLSIRQNQIQAARSDVQFEVLPNTGHWLQYEQSDWFNQRAITWVEKGTL